jgi:hypothetical protein
VEKSYFVGAVGLTEVRTGIYCYHLIGVVGVIAGLCSSV